MQFATMFLMGLSLLALVVAAPTKIDAPVADLSLSRNGLGVVELLCPTIKCLFGNAFIEPSSLSCVCPDWPEWLTRSPCEDLVCDGDRDPFYSFIEQACRCRSMEEWRELEREVLESMSEPDDENSFELRRREVPTSSTAPVYSAIPTFIPPPKQTITPALLNQSLTTQPQDNATVSSIIPFFRADVLKIYLQLNGLVADLLEVNASASFPCGTIGLDPEPDLALVPKVVQQGQGQPEVVVADCQCIAVNMYNPNVINYWIQKQDGTIYSLVGSNEVLGIDKMNTSQSTALRIVTMPVNATKRSTPDIVEYVQPVKRQIFSIDCDKSCPFYHMHLIKGGDGYCGCMFNGADEEMHLTTRGIVAPEVNTATMTEAACKAMTCFNNNNTPAVFNPFSRTCWCNTPAYVESNPSAWSPTS
ncbi:hypothetical protein PV11_08083 [Exophiala sideris]|uniref:Extracellular membrane protein CFEM domain-containing protein n=1 Tax=Exophiala sideris TaxID=1016849 RepID=A0A0D1YC88_9EURO|nr:hypothetical protein PV11_08083 [Exophiala sideris]